MSTKFFFLNYEYTGHASLSLLGKQMIKYNLFKSNLNFTFYDNYQIYMIGLKY